jgi:hypothetical protein
MERSTEEEEEEKEEKTLKEKSLLFCCRKEAAAVYNFLVDMVGALSRDPLNLWVWPPPTPVRS